MKKIDIAVSRHARYPIGKTICIMKLSVLLLLLSFQISARSLSQTVTLTIKNEKLGKVLKIIERQTGYRFGYSNLIVPVEKNVSLQVKDGSLKQALDQLLTGLHLDYREEPGKLIVIFQAQGKTVGPDPGSSADTTITIKGKIMTTDGNPLQAASVVIKGTTLGTVTNDKGEFELINVKKGDIVQVSSLGFDGAEMTIDNRATYILQLHYSIDAGKLDEVVVQGYGKEKKKNLIGTITKIPAEDIKNQPVANVLSALQGMAPGLEVSTSAGTPGAGVQMRIRGINTMNDVGTVSGIGTGFVALVLVDAVPVTDLTFLSPSDIESVEVLKDAAATAIYGSRGAGGVLLITTKKGARGSGSGKLSFNAYTSFNKPTRTAKMLNSDDYRMLRKEGFANDGITITPALAPDLYMDSTVNTDWSKTLYKNALAQDYQLNFSGGSNTINYYISGGYRNEDAIVRGDWYLKRMNVRMGLDAKVSDRLSIGGGLGFTANNTNTYTTAISTTIYYAIPLIPADQAGEPNLTAYPIPLMNPNRQLASFTKGTTNTLIGNFYFNFRVWKQLFFRTDVSTQYISGQSTVFTPTTSVPFSNFGTVGYPSGTYLNNSSTMSTVEPQLNYALTIRKHALKLLGGGTLIDRTNKSGSLSMTGYSSNLLTTLASATTYSYSTYSEVPYKFASAFGRASYIYDEKYLAEGVFRRDGSSRFGANYQYGNFWSAGAGWIFSQEAFIKQLLGNDFFGKFKVTYGVTGNDNIGDFGFLSYSSTGNYGGSTASYLSNLANPYLHWEQTKKLDFGLDLSLLKDRLSVTANYFRHRTEGTLFSQALSVATGFTNITSNLNGVVANNGFELALTAVPIKTRSFRWNSMFNISFLKNKLLSLPGLANLANYNRYSYKVGQPLALNWGFNYLGVDQATGLAKFQDVDGSGTIASYTPDQQVLGKSIPDFYGGWNNTFEYRHFDLQVMTQFVSGGQKSYTTFTSFIGDEYNLPVSALHRWHDAKDITDIPRAAAPGSAAAINNAKLTSSSFAFSDASYIRIKTITLGYSLPAIRGLRISNLRVFATGYNLFTITGYKGNDPESGSSYVPLTKSYTVGINLNL